MSWFLLDRRWLACVVSRDGLRLVEGDAAGLAAEIAQARFQIDALRFGDTRLAPQMPRLVERARLRLQALHRRLAAPLAPLLAGCDRLVLLPHGLLNGLPFAALHDGREHWIDRHDAPAACAGSRAICDGCRSHRSLAEGLRCGVQCQGPREAATFYHPEVTIYEGGGINNGWLDYRDHHLGPELKAFENLQFGHRDVTVTVLAGGQSAYATSRYSLKARMKDREIDSEGLATYLLMKGADGGWRIRHSLTSSRPARRPGQ